MSDYNYIIPDHYKTDKGDYVDHLKRTNGILRAIHFCEDTAGKYGWRSGKKPGEPEERENQKAQQYLERAKKLRKELYSLPTASDIHFE